MAARRRLLDLLAYQYADMEREKLYALILAGKVRVNGERVRDPGRQIASEARIELDSSQPYVSRAGAKLQAALDAWNVDVRDKVVVDGGASTGGFTDCLLRYGAGQVYAVDVGTNQLDYRLRSDRRVVAMEGTSVLDLQDLDPQPDFAVCDLSFRSLEGAARHLVQLCSGAMLIALVKPQFERAYLGSGSRSFRDVDSTFSGVVPDDEAEVILLDTQARLRQEGLECERVMESPLRGAKGNREYLVMVRPAAPAD